MIVEAGVSARKVTGHASVNVWETSEGVIDPSVHM